VQYERRWNPGVAGEIGRQGEGKECHNNHGEGFCVCHTQKRTLYAIEMSVV
jgi:hypothetical protein